MGFVKRLGFYLFGLAIGIIFLAVFFKNKTEETGTEFCYFPNCRTLKDMRSKPLHFSDNIKKAITENKIDSITITQFFTEGDVDFKNSNTKSTPCKTYKIDGPDNEKKRTITVINCPDKLIVQDLSI